MISVPKAPYSTVHHEKVRRGDGSVFFDSKFPLLFLAAQKQKKGIVVGENTQREKSHENIPIQ